jgi:hypothetical protein
MNKARNFILKTMAFGLLFGFTAPIKADNKAVVMRPIRAAMEKPLKAARSVANAVVTAVRHPKITASVALGSTALYLAYKKSYVQDWTAAIEKAKKVTRPMLRNVAKPAGTEQYAYLLFEELPTAHDIFSNPEIIYDKLLKCSERDEPGVIKSIIKDINKQRIDLENDVKAGLEKCLSACTLLPKFEIIPVDDQDTETENSVTQIIDSNTKRLGSRVKKLKLYELSNDAIRTIHKEIMDESSVSIFNPYKLLRYWMFPFESEAMRQYWKVRQLIERLNAIEYCLNQRTAPKTRLPIVAL